MFERKKAGSVRNVLGLEDRLVSIDTALKKVEPGMSIFLGTGPAEPRSLVKRLLEMRAGNLQDLELIQLVSFGAAVPLEEIKIQKYRLKTFFSGWVASEAIAEGKVDLIPSRFSKVPGLVRSGRLPIDAAFIQITPPDEYGHCSLGLAVDMARQAMEQASLVVGEINPDIPRTYGDTFVNSADFDCLVETTEGAMTFPRWPVDQVFDDLASNVAAVIENGSCLGFSIGPLYEALSEKLKDKKNLGIHTPFFTDAVMQLILSGAVTNRNKRVFSGKSVTSYALGSQELLAWLDKNPFVEFQPMEKVFDPVYIGRNPGFTSVLPARKVDLSGRIALHAGKGNVTAGPGEAMDFVFGAELSDGGRTIFALPSRNVEGEANIRLSVESFPNLFSLKESVDMVATEYGTAFLQGRSVRERAMALIDIAHPDDRLQLVEEAKQARVLYADQMYLEKSGKLYPDEISTQETVAGGLTVRFRPIKPSDEEGMRKLFYSLSDQAVYYRYFTPIKAMPHQRMQEYVNIDFDRVMSVVGLVGPPGEGRIIAEARYVKYEQSNWADLAFWVQEEYQGKGVASAMFRLLMRVAKDRCIQGFTADVLPENKGMLRVFEKAAGHVDITMQQGVYEVSIPLEQASECRLGDKELET